MRAEMSAVKQQLQQQPEAPGQSPGAGAYPQGLAPAGLHGAPPPTGSLPASTPAAAGPLPQASLSQLQGLSEVQRRAPTPGSASVS